MKRVRIKDGLEHKYPQDKERPWYIGKWVGPNHIDSVAQGREIEVEESSHEDYYKVGGRDKQWANEHVLGKKEAWILKDDCEVLD